MLVRTDMRPDAIVDWIANDLISGWSSPSGSAWTRGQRRKTASATLPIVSVEITCATTTADEQPVETVLRADAIATSRSSIDQSSSMPRRS